MSNLLFTLQNYRLIICKEIYCKLFTTCVFLTASLHAISKIFESIQKEKTGFEYKFYTAHGHPRQCITGPLVIHIATYLFATTMIWISKLQHTRMAFPKWYPISQHTYVQSCMNYYYVHYIKTIKLMYNARNYCNRMFVMCKEN